MFEPSIESRAEKAGDRDALDDFLPTASLETLRLRAKLLDAVRQFFNARSYWEVETPILSHDIVVDAYLEPFATACLVDAAKGSRGSRTELAEELFLQTSPEFGMKRLLAAGAEAIFQITRAMRNGETGRHHNCEFTMVEWYRVGDTHNDQMQFVEDLILDLRDQTAAHCCETTVPLRNGDFGNLGAPFVRMTYEEAFERYAGCRVLSQTPLQLAALARRRQLTPPPSLRDDDRDGWLNLLFAELVAPQLGRLRPVFLYNYPASQAALARVSKENSAVAERFELFVNGVEICNGYHELTDPAEFRRRIEEQSRLRRLTGSRRLPAANRLLAAMEAGLPACAGVALGFDRLVMCLLGRETLAEVMAFPHDRA
jgi:lysyl-tRNA synthetase class 2